MENRIKEQFSLFAGRVSAETISANQLRLYFSAMAYVLLEGVRRLGLKGTEMARAQVATIRLRLLKIGAQIRITARKVWVAILYVLGLSRYLKTVLYGLIRRSRYAANNAYFREVTLAAASPPVLEQLLGEPE